MRLPLPTDLTTRDGLATKDARLVNAFVDGEMVVKRPATDTALATHAGTAQGGIAIGSQVIFFNGDVSHIL